MEPLFISGTNNTPTVKFDGAQGIIEITGRSNPENSIAFYKPLMDWLEEYFNSPAALTNVNIKLEYFNTSSSKFILNILKKLELISKNKNEVKINWYYQNGDEDMLEAANDYESLIQIPFYIIASENMA
jgi:hypothetical protein